MPQALRPSVLSGTWVTDHSEQQREQAVPQMYPQEGAAADVRGAEKVPGPEHAATDVSGRLRTSRMAPRAGFEIDCKHVMCMVPCFARNYSTPSDTPGPSA